MSVNDATNIAISATSVPSVTHEILAVLDDVGYLHIPAFTEPNAEYQTRLYKLISALSTPLHVYRNHDYWKELPADISRPRTRSGGIGLNSLHIDLVNLENPPDIIAFYCVRGDPAGGGRTLACSLNDLQVPKEILDELERPIYKDGAAYDLDGVGNDCQPFAIYNPDSDWKWRWSGRILETIKDQDESVDYEALLEFDRILNNHAIGVELQPGDVMLVNQKTVLHGRLPMGSHQERWELSERRLVIQAYGRR